MPRAAIAASSAGKNSAPVRGAEAGCRRRAPSRSRRVIEREARREHGVVGDARPRVAVVHLGVVDGKPAHVDAVEPEERQPRREAARRTAAVVAEHFDQPELGGEPLADAVAPVVEIAGDDERRVLGHVLDDPIDQRVQLLAPSALDQREVHAQAVHRDPGGGNLHLAMQQPRGFRTDARRRPDFPRRRSGSATGSRCRGGRGRRRRCGRRRTRPTRCRRGTRTAAPRASRGSGRRAARARPAPPAGRRCRRRARAAGRAARA